MVVFKVFKVAVFGMCAPLKVTERVIFNIRVDVVSI